MKESIKEIVRYANRKLYDRAESKYINLNQLVKLPLGSFRVVEHETKKDVTMRTLMSFLATYNDQEDAKRVMRHCLDTLHNGG